jgi:simple sugar transport system ATP-binding protein
MVGAGVDASVRPAPRQPVRGVAPALRIDGLTVRSRRRGLELDDVTLEVRPGEVVGVAGAEGSGQHVLVDLLSSLRAATSGTVEVAGVQVQTGRPGAMGRAGVAVIPADRHDSGCILDMTVEENLVMTGTGRVAARGVFDRQRMRARSEELIAEFGIACPGPDAPMFALSGGNQQRVVVARELSAGSPVLVAAQPVRGLDVRAAGDVAGRLRRAAVGGTAILLVSSEIDELLELADRIVVLSRGRIAGEVEPGDGARARIQLLIGGAS